MLDFFSTCWAWMEPRLTFFNIFTFILMVVNLYGTILNNHQKISCFYIWGTCNIIWGCVNFSKGIFWQGVQNLIFLYLNIQGYLAWRRLNQSDKKQKKEEHSV